MWVYEPKYTLIVPFIKTLQGRRGHCSLSSKKERRKRYRQKKKAIHRIGKEPWEIIANEKLQQRWQERSCNAYAAYLAELEEKEKKEEEEKARDFQLKRTTEIEQVKRNERVDRIEDHYAQYRTKASHQNTGPLLLDAVLIPIKEPTPTSPSDSLVHATQCIDHVRIARSERNQALRLARHYRNVAERTHREKRDLQHKLQTQIEVVRDFWRNQVVEGGCRSGKILRAALLRK